MHAVTLASSCACENSVWWEAWWMGWLGMGSIWGLE